MSTIKKGAIITTEIVDMDHKGDGIGRVGSTVVFIKGAVIGDKVKAVAKTTAAKKNYFTAELIEIEELSPLRKTQWEVCPHKAEGCGGCKLSELEYTAQADLKVKQLTETLKRIGRIEEPEVKSIIEADHIYNYRNKAVLSQDNGKVGFLAGRSNRVIDCETCQINADETMAVARAVRRYIAANPDAGKRIKQILVRLGEVDETGEREVQIGILDKAKTFDPIIELAEEIAEDVNLVSFYWAKDADKWRHVAGKTTINCRIGEKRYEVSPGAFFQINDEQVLKLYDKVKEYAGLTGEEVILDAYCGVGTIGLHLADKAKYIVGIEKVRAAILDANRNATINGVVNARYFVGTSESTLSQLYAGHRNDFELEKIDVAIVDPPRAGCAWPLIDTLVQRRVKKIIYVSCDPATLARDVAILQENGYTFKECTPVDMFPQCNNIETVALLSRA